MKSDGEAMKTAQFFALAPLMVVLNHAAAASDLPTCDPLPTPVERIPPDWPVVESYLPVEGFAVVAFTISESGEVDDVKLVEAGSEPSYDGFTRGFGRSAVRAISQWRYEPRQQACRTDMKLTFKLEE
jgi:TonB family protein